MIASQFEYLKQYLKAKSGLVLTNEKQYLVQAGYIEICAHSKTTGEGESIGAFGQKTKIS